MDDARFDAFALRTGAVVARRVAFGGGIATLISVLDPGGMGARKKKKKKKKRCKGGARRTCGKACIDLARSGANCGACGTVCGTGVCINGVCTCGAAPCACTCQQHLAGDDVCVQAATAQSCDADAECGLGKACLAIGKCAAACPSV